MNLGGSSLGLRNAAMRSGILASRRVSHCLMRLGVESLAEQSGVEKAEAAVLLKGAGDGIHPRETDGDGRCLVLGVGRPMPAKENAPGRKHGVTDKPPKTSNAESTRDAGR